ncbi:MAG: YtxH domain-containing protein [Sporolactobacillus sp.]
MGVCNANKSCSGLSGKGLFIGGIIGGAVGAVTALLLAPKTGEELRQNIDLKSAVNSGVEKIKLAASQAKSKAVDLVKKDDEPFS